MHGYSAFYSVFCFSYIETIGILTEIGAKTIASHRLLTTITQSL